MSTKSTAATLVAAALTIGGATYGLTSVVDSEAATTATSTTSTSSTSSTSTDQSATGVTVSTGSGAAQGATSGS